MNTRRALTGLLLVLMTSGAYFLTRPFRAALDYSARAENDSLVEVDIPPLVAGELLRVEVNGYVLFLLKPDPAQADAIRALDAHVWHPDTGTYNRALGAYVYWGYSTRWGCPLELQPPRQSPLLDWEKNARWLGGYFDWRCEASYDYAGRSIKTHELTYIGYDEELPNLWTPTVFKKSHDKYIVSIFHRR